MTIEQLRQIATHHAKQVRTRCKIVAIAEPHEMLEDNYVFFAIYRCKKNFQFKRIVLDENGELTQIII